MPIGKINVYPWILFDIAWVSFMYSLNGLFYYLLFATVENSYISKQRKYRKGPKSKTGIGKQTSSQQFHCVSNNKEVVEEILTHIANGIH